MDVQQQLNQIFHSETYKKVTEAIKKEFILSTALLGENHLPKEQDWTPVTEPIKLKSQNWQVKIYRFVTATEVLGNPTFLTFVRFVPPPAIKTALETLSKDDVEWQNAVKAYSEAVTSDEANKVKVDIMQLLENQIFPDKNFHFTPDPQAYGLLPHFDFDLIIPFIGLPSLITNSGGEIKSL